MTTIRETTLPNRLYQGKVRDTYNLGDGLLLMVPPTAHPPSMSSYPQAYPRRAQSSARFPPSGST